MVPLGWRISAWVCAGGIQLANIRVTWSLSLRVRCQYYCVGGQPIISAQHFNVEFLQCTDGSWCPLECWWQFNTYRFSTLKGGTLTEILGSSPGQEAWLMSFAMEKPQSTWGSQMCCYSPAPSLRLHGERPNFVFFDLRSKEVGCVRRVWSTGSGDPMQLTDLIWLLGVHGPHADCTFC